MLIETENVDSLTQFSLVIIKGGADIDGCRYKDVVDNPCPIIFENLRSKFNLSYKVGYMTCIFCMGSGKKFKVVNFQKS